MGFTESPLRISSLTPLWPLDTAAVTAHVISLLPTKYWKQSTERQQERGGKKRMHERAMCRRRKLADSTQERRTGTSLLLPPWQRKPDSRRIYVISCWTADYEIPKAFLLSQFFSKMFCKWAKINFRSTATSWRQAITPKADVLSRELLWP